MSDFISGGWSIFIGALTIAGLVACLALLIIASRRRVMSDDNTTGHVWDEDLKELNNPLPRWWMWLFVITVIFAGAYLALYPGLGSHPGSLKWSSSGQLQTETEKAVAAMTPVYAKFATMSAADLAKEPQAMGIGERLFLNNCAACHGSDGRGSKGFVAINRTGSAATTTYQTGMAAGFYCDVVHYDYRSNGCYLSGTNMPAPFSALIRVEADGQILSKNVASMDAFAIYGSGMPAPRSRPLLSKGVCAVNLHSCLRG
jgi:mono/diheme cytochrome c family protein